MGIFVIILVFLAHPHIPMLHTFVALKDFKLSINLHSHDPSSRTRSLPIKRENTLNLLGSQENNF